MITNQSLLINKKNPHIAARVLSLILNTNLASHRLDKASGLNTSICNIPV